MKGALTRKSHSGTPGSKAACAYPGRYRGLPRPSSALKPSHSPDSVACFGPLVVFVWRLVKTLIVYISCCCVVASSCLAYAWCHFDLRACLGKVSSPFTPHRLGGELHQFDGITHIAELH